MRILVIDDDRVFTETLLWRLGKEGHEVVYCQSVAEVLDGWYEVTEETLSGLREHRAPRIALQRLERLAGIKYATKAKFEGALREGPPPLPPTEPLDDILEIAQQRAFEPEPDVVILDMMMPAGEHYSVLRTDEGRETGIVLLDDIVKDHPQVPVVVCTVRTEWDFHERVRNRSANVKAILTKPITPSQVVARLRELFPATGGANQ